MLDNSDQLPKYVAYLSVYPVVRQCDRLPSPPPLLLVSLVFPSSPPPAMVSTKWMAVGLTAAAAVAQVAAAPGDVGTTIAGYKFVEEVSQQARIDLDVRAVENAKSNYAFARTVYTKGSNSEAEEGGKRTLQGFSTEYASPGIARTEPLAIMSKVFWGDWDYANKHLLAALGGFNSAKYGLYGSGALAKTAAARQQIIKKVIKFSLIPQYVQRELAKTMTDYKKGLESAAEHWDEAWAFYAGSLENGSGNGYSAYILAEKRSANFGTKAGGRSRVNQRFLAAMKKGQGQVSKPGQVGALLQTVKCIRGLMVVPAIQGCLRYSYKVSDPAVSSAANLAKESAEAWAFCAAALPGLASVDRAAAGRVRFQTFLGGNKRVNWPIVRAAFGAKNLNKMGVRCSDVGALNVEYPQSQHSVCKDGKLSNPNQGTNFC